MPWQLHAVRFNHYCCNFVTKKQGQGRSLAPDLASSITYAILKTMQWATQQKQTGFTIVELLIVIVVIAILASIAIVAYNGIQNSAYDSSVRSDLSANHKTLELYRINSTDDSYPSHSALAGVGLRATKSAYTPERNNFYYCRSADGKTYAIGVITKSNQGYIMANGQVSNTSSAGTYLSHTCTAANSSSSYGTSGFTPSTQWESWIGG